MGYYSERSCKKPWYPERKGSLKDKTALVPNATISTPSVQDWKFRNALILLMLMWTIPRGSLIVMRHGWVVI